MRCAAGEVSAARAGSSRTTCRRRRRASTSKVCSPTSSCSRSPPLRSTRTQSPSSSSPSARPGSCSTKTRADCSSCSVLLCTVYSRYELSAHYSIKLKTESSFIYLITYELCSIFPLALNSFSTFNFFGQFLISSNIFTMIVRAKTCDSTCCCRQHGAAAAGQRELDEQHDGHEHVRGH